jgi:hypothetical protein
MRYFTSIVLLILLGFIANCTKETNDSPNTGKEFMLLKNVATFNSDSESSYFIEYTYYSDDRLKQINENDEFTLDLTYSVDTLFSHQNNPLGINDFYDKTYRMNDSMVYVEHTYVDHPYGNPDSVISIDTTINLYVYYLGECGYRKRIDEGGDHLNNLIYTDENCSWTTENRVHTLDDKHSYLTSVVTNLHTNYNVGNIIYYRSSTGPAYTYDYIYNDNDYPESAIIHDVTNGWDFQSTYEYY